MTATEDLVAPDPSYLRNIGIMAHVDHGKTTLTERMLFYAGKTRKLGSVDDGNTVMDFLPQERERGITINSAAVSFDWKEHKFNLIDTPGHVDFTFETQRSLRVLDGAVLVLDAVSGVQSQTMTVWRQADNFSVPRFAFVNKMDRDGASLNRVSQSMKSRLGVECLAIQLPVEEEDRFVGLIDLVGLKMLKWEDSKHGGKFSARPLRRDHAQFEEALSAREALVESLSEIDEEFADCYLEAMEHENKPWSHDDAVEGTALVCDVDLWAALRRVVLTPKSGALVTMCGAAAKNVGVQPLMDGVVKLLPSPLDRTAPIAKNVKTGKEVEIGMDKDEPLLAFVFKVQHDPQRGGICFFRVYSGTMHSRQVLINATVGHKERANKLLVMNANATEEVDEVVAGGIGAIVGLKATRTGDTLVGPTGHDGWLVLPGISIPHPVFTSSVKVKQSSEKDLLIDALKIMEKEDPSLRVVLEDPDTEETLVSGMGELHMEIVGDKLRNQFKVPSVVMGKPRISYRESLIESTYASYASESFVGDTRHYAQVFVHLLPLADREDGVENMVCINFADQSIPILSDCQHHTTSESTDFHFVKNGGLDNSGMSAMMKRKIQPIAKGVKDALAAGPLAGFPLTGILVKIEEDKCDFTEESTPAAIVRATKRAIHRAMEKHLSAVQLLEPVMNVEITADASRIGSVLADLNSTRRAIVREVGGEENESNLPGAYASVFASVPLRELVGYSTSLRSLTAGEGTFSMEFDSYSPVMIQKTAADIILEATEGKTSAGTIGLNVLYQIPA